MRYFYKVAIWLDKYKSLFIAIIFVGIFSLGYHIYSSVDYKLDRYSALSKTADLFIDALPDKIGVDNKEPTKDLKLVSIFAKATLFLAVFILFIKSIVASIYSYLLAKKGNHILVIGLDSNSRFFIDSADDKENILVVENDEYNPYIEVYREKAIPVLHNEIESVIDNIGINSAKYIFVSTGDSQENIATALKIIANAKEDSNRKMLIHIENRTLRSLYNDSSLLDSKRFDIQPFSFYKESAKMLFLEHDIDGDGYDIIESSKPFEIAVVGSSNLAIEVIVEAIKMSHLPNENRLIINCIDRDIDKLKSRVEYEIPYISEVGHIEFNYIELDYEKIEFYRNSIWNRDNLKHVFICYPETVTNINISTKLKRVAYKGNIEHSVHKVHVATYSQIEISKELRKYNRKNGDISIFAAANLICDINNLIDTKIEKIAKLIQYSYTLKEYKESNCSDFKKEVKKPWGSDITINDKRSSIAQAKHIKVKLKALGLKKVESAKSAEELEEINKKVFNRILSQEREKLNIDDKKLLEYSKEFDKYYRDKSKEYKVHYFPKDYNTTFEKLLRAEHNRWITMLIMMDNHYDPKAKGMDATDRKIKKIHYLMKSYDEFKEDEKMLIFYDIYSILYIPSYLACLRYELKEDKQEEGRVKSN